jgi:hypothetical protein
MKSSEKPYKYKQRPLAQSTYQSKDTLRHKAGWHFPALASRIGGLFATHIEFLPPR